MSTIGQRIRARRISLGLSVDDLAYRLSKNRATVYRYESDEIENLPVGVIAHLADALSVSPAYLMGWEAAPEAPPAAPLSPSEETVLTLFRELNEEGQEKLTTYAEDLLSSGRYKKTDQYLLGNG